MNSTAAGKDGTPVYEPAVVDHTPHGRSTVLTIALGVLVLAIVAGAQLLPPQPANALIGIAAIAFSAFGVLSLFALAMGIAGFRSDTGGDVLARAIADGEDAGLLVTDATGRVHYANRAYADLTGALKARDVRTIERVFSRVGEADGDIYRLNQRAARGEAATADVRVHDHPGLAQAGETRWYRISCQPLAAAPERGEGHTALTAWRIADVTVERQTREREFADLRDAVATLDAAPAGFLTHDSKERVRFMDADLAQRLGVDLGCVRAGELRLSDVVARRSTAQAVLADGTRVRDVALRGRAGGAVQSRSRRVETSEGDTLTHMVLLDRSGADTASSSRAARLFAQSPMAIASLDADGTVVESNAAFARVFAGEASVPARLADLAAKAEVEALQEAFETARDGRAPAPLEIVTLGGEIVRVHLLAPGGDGADDGEANEAVLLYALDVTEQRALERQMADAQKNQAIGVIAGGVAHDFNNVLTAIVGFADLLLAKYRPSDRSFHDVTQIRNTAFKGASLVRQLLAYTRRQTLRPKTVSMPDLLTDLSMILRRLAGDRIKVEVKHGRDLWPVRADVGALERVFVNLCVNARDAIDDRAEGDAAAGREPAERAIRIRTRNVAADDVRRTVNDPEARAADHLMIEVSDTGTGMTPEVMAKVFDPFFTTKKAGKGTGLGLSSVVGIVQQSGGSIHLDSRLGEGTTFRILLPRHIPTEAELEAPVETAKEAARDLAGSAIILFVEDEDSVRAFGTRTLKERGYTVHEAENGEDALEILEDLEGRVDLVVSDVVMPEMDGPTLFRHVRETLPDLPFVFASGYAEEAFEKSLPDAADARFTFIPKPYTLKDLAIVVKDTLEEERARAA